MKYILALDEGTTSSRAIIFDKDSNIVATEQQEFTILSDPRAELSVAQMQEQFEFVNRVNKTVDEAHKAIKNIRSITKKLTDFESNYGSMEETATLLEKVKGLKNEFSEIEKALYQTQNKSNQDPLNFPIKLTNKLGHLNSLVGIDDFPPTNQKKHFDQLSAKMFYPSYLVPWHHFRIHLQGQCPYNLLHLNGLPNNCQ